MDRETRRLVTGGVVGFGAALAAGYGLIVRPWHLTWGTAEEELVETMPCDDAVARPNYCTTRAITIDAPPEQVWPWLVQMGELPRGGFYSYEWIERAMGMRVANAGTILPEFQELKPGDNLDRGGNMRVRFVDPPHSLVLGPPQGLSEGDATWSITLRPLGDQTRLVSRVRAHFAPTIRSVILYALLDPGQFVMERKWLLGVKARAEAARQAGS